MWFWEVEADLYSFTGVKPIVWRRTGIGLEKKFTSEANFIDSFGVTNIIFVEAIGTGSFGCIVQSGCSEYSRLDAWLEGGPCAADAESIIDFELEWLEDY